MSWAGGSGGRGGRRGFVTATEVGVGSGGVCSYPSHLRPVDVHRLQLGLISSHLTLRILQVVQPVRTFGLLALFLRGGSELVAAC
jgi:hypothetical protein